jgi:hypothetical protein
MSATWVTIRDNAFGGRKAFEQAVSRAQRGKVKGLITRKPTRLSSLEGRSKSGRHLGLVEVSLDQICGSEGHRDDFDSEFNPLRKESRDQWVGVYNARARGIPLGPVQLVKVGDVYYVRDGHHRISVARAMGMRTIEADVTVQS